MIVYFILAILIVLISFYVHELHKFNPNAELIQIQESNKSIISEKIKEKSPLLIHNLSNKVEFTGVTIDNLVLNNPGYIIKDNNKYISLDAFNNKEIDQICVIDNERMIEDFNLKSSLKEINNLFMDTLSCNLTIKLNILKGNHKITLQKNKHNYLLLTQLTGESTVFIVNPKHGDILTKNYTESKKWAFKIILKKGISLYIPPEWYYMYEVNKDSIHVSSYCDNYFTYLYNLLR